MTKKAWVILGTVLFIVCAFFIVSLCLASAHGQDVVTEWQTWFGIVEEVVETIPPTEEVVEPTMLFVD